MTNLTRVPVYDSHGQPKNVHVHDSGFVQCGNPVLLIDGQPYVVVEVAM